MSPGSGGVPATEKRENGVHCTQYVSFYTVYFVQMTKIQAKSIVVVCMCVSEYAWVVLRERNSV